MREVGNVCRILLEILKGKENFEDLRVDGRIILKCVFRNYVGTV
jgi:hypothetical protein